MKLQGYENGYFVGATIFENVKPDMKIYKEEIFWSSFKHDDDRHL